MGYCKSQCNTYNNTNLTVQIQQQKVFNCTCTKQQLFCGPLFICFEHSKTKTSKGVQCSPSWEDCTSLHEQTCIYYK